MPTFYGGATRCVTHSLPNVLPGIAEVITICCNASLFTNIAHSGAGAVWIRGKIGATYLAVCLHRYVKILLLDRSYKHSSKADVS